MDHVDRPALRDLMHAQRRRTGVALGELLSGHCGISRSDLDGLTDFYRTGSGDVDDAVLSEVISLWRTLPPRAEAVSRKKERTSLTPLVQAELRRHWLRVGLSVEAFLAGLAKPPARLTSRMLYHWLSDEPPARVRKDHLEAVMTGWAALPDGLGVPRRTHFIPFERTAPDDADRDRP